MIVVITATGLALVPYHTGMASFNRLALENIGAKKVTGRLLAKASQEEEAGAASDQQPLGLLDLQVS